MKIAVEGCAHGELENIYDTIQHLEEQDDIKIDLLICCGDFQATRNEDDLRCMAIPQKYYDMCTFYKYYSGEKTAPILTIFVGGNHEASNYLQEMPYGGWVAPNIYYLGYAGVINIAGVRIGGLSGIYKGMDYLKGHFEKAPYNENSKRSVYHIRNLEVFRLKQVSQPIQIFLSHDWPSGIWEHGDKRQLLKFKPFFKDDMESGKLGSKPCQELLGHLKPDYYFAAHLHCKFAALVRHSGDKVTKFLALDKCLPKRRFLQVVEVPHDENEKIELSYDAEWLAILRSTNHLLSIRNGVQYMPGPSGNERWSFAPTEEEISCINQRFQTLKIPNNFVKTAPVYSAETSPKNNPKQPPAKLNPQTTAFCSKLGIDDPVELLLKSLNINDASFYADDFENAGESSFVEDTEKRNSFASLTRLSLPQPVNNDYDDEISRNERTFESFTSKTENTFESLNSKSENTFESLNSKSGNTFESLNSKSENTFESFNSKTGNTFESLNSKTENTFDSFNSKTGNTFESFSSVNENSFEGLSPKNLNVNESFTSKSENTFDSSKNVLETSSSSGNLDMTSLSFASNDSIQESPRPKKFIKRNADIYKDQQ